MGLRRFLAALGTPVAATARSGVAPTVGVPFPVEQDPDAPVNFGDGLQWFAVKTTEPRGPASALGLGAAYAANWATGVAGVAAQPGASGWVFVSPSVAGWVFVLGSGLGGPDQRSPLTAAQQRGAHTFDRRFSSLYGRFADVQFFGTQRGSEYAAWARALNGRVARVFAVADTHVLANVGQQSGEESVLKLLNLSGLSLPAAERALTNAAGRRLPDGQVVLAVAGAWGIDPSKLSGRCLPTGVGFVARLSPGAE